MSADLLGNRGAPRIICAGCGQLTTLTKPICDECIRAGGGTPMTPCVLCESGLPLDKTGALHVTKTGGYAGRCTAEPA